jgi:signal transduction histidine kinase
VELKKKLIYWMVAVVTMAILTVGVSISYWTHHLFNDYVDQHFQYRSQQLQEIFAGYYQQNNSWSGASELFVFSQTRPMMMMGRQWRNSSQDGMANLLGILAPGERVRLVDTDGRVLVDSLGDPGRWNQGPVAQERLRFASPVIVDEQPVGFLLWDTAELTNVQSLEKRFIDSLFKTTLAAVIIIGFGAALGARRVAAKLVAPLEALTRAARSYTRDQALQPVPRQGVNSREVEELTRAFNQMVTQLNENEKLRRQLMADVAHELRTPLAVLRCNLEALAAGVTLPDAENLAQLENEAERLAGLVEELQELSLLEQKKLVLNLREKNLAELVQQAVDFFRVEADWRSINLEVTTPGTAVAWIDSRRFTQIMVNLLVNAFRYVPDGGKIKVAIKSAPDSSSWQVELADNGPGIPKEDLPYIFERFYKSDKARTRNKSGMLADLSANITASGEERVSDLRGHEGVGLGLAIVKALVDAHGGKIWVSNQVSGGAIFSINLPKTFLSRE